MSEGTINLRLLTDDGTASSYDVVARIEPFDLAEKSGRKALDLVIPASAPDGYDVALGTGFYNVQLFLPNGSVLQQACEVQDGLSLGLKFSEPAQGQGLFSLQGSTSARSLSQVLGNAVDSRSAGTRSTASAMAPSASTRSITAAGARGPARQTQREAVSPRSGSLKRGGVGLTRSDGQRSGAPLARQPIRRVASRGSPVAAPPRSYGNPAAVQLRLIPLGGFEGATSWRELANGPPTSANVTLPHRETPPDVVREGAAIWRLPGTVAGPEVGYGRVWGLVRTPKGMEAVSLPAPWRCSGSGLLSTVDLLVDGAIGGRASTSVAINDPELNGLLSYLDRGQLSAVRPVLSQLEKSGIIERTIDQKMGNPLAACAAAYVGLAVHDPSATQRWDAWLSNITNWFPWLPDGPIAEARRIVLRPQTVDGGAAALRLLERAFEAGVPYFGTGLLLMREMLEMLEPEHERAGALLEQVLPVVARCDPKQMFTVLRYPEVRS